MQQPAPKIEIMARRAEILAGLRAILPDEAVIGEAISLKPYETDGLTAYRQVPLAVVLPETEAEVVAVVKFCHLHGIRMVPRGAGTSLSGGALPLADAVVVGMMRMNEILEINYEDRYAVVQPGVTNIAITQAVEDRQFFYAPDPSSQLACMIGGNVSMNSGGAHCLKYGVTANNLLGLRLVTVEGEVLEIGGTHMDAAGYDWLGLITGSEGQLGIVTQVTVRILRSPEGQRAMLAGFSSNEVAGACVDAIISSGIIPVALEFMDKPAIHACEAFAHAGYPLDAEALLIIEVEGSKDEQTDFLTRIRDICAGFEPISMVVSQSAAQSAAIWKGRKGAFGAIGRISPDYLCMGEDAADALGALVDYKNKNYTLDYLGTEDVDGTAAHKLRVTRPNGDVLYVYLDPDYFLEIRTLSRRIEHGVPSETVTDYGDYEKFNGVYFPLSVASGPKGSTDRQSVQYDTADINPATDGAQFRFPGATAGVTHE